MIGAKSIFLYILLYISCNRLLIKLRKFSNECMRPKKLISYMYALKILIFMQDSHLFT